MKRYFTNSFTLLLLLCLTGALSAQDRGGYAGSFLRMGLGARARALGGAYTAVQGDGYSLYYNMAGLSTVSDKEAIFSYRSLSLDRTLSYIGYTMPLPPMAGIGIGWMNAGIDNIDGRDFSGNHTGMLDDNQNALMFGFGLSLPHNISIGVGGTYLREILLDITASGLGINLGVFMQPHDLVSVGLSIRDLRAKYAWNSESLFDRGSATNDQFPTIITLGTSVKIPRYNSLVLLDIYQNSKSDPAARLGVEYELNEQAALRAGLNDHGPTGGMGIMLKISRLLSKLDYAFEMSDIDPEGTHILSFRILF